MAKQSRFTEQVTVTLNAVAPVLQDLKGRADADDQKTTIAALSSFQVTLQKYQTAPTSSAADTIQIDETPPIQTLVSAQLEDNSNMIKMGQLNTKRIIAPSTLEGFNKRLTNLQTSLQILATLPTDVSCFSGPAFPESKDAKSGSQPNLEDYTPVKVSVLPNDPDVAPNSSTITVLKPKTPTE